MTQDIKTLVHNARQAQAVWEKADQKKTDNVVREIARIVNKNAEELARLTVEETGMGTYKHNLLQDQRKALIIWNDLKGKKSKGIINRDKKTGFVEIAKPIGVVAAVLPVTIPVTNFMSNTMFSLKGGNAIIGAPHPKAKQTIGRTAELFWEVLDRFDVPKNLIQYVAEPSIDKTKELMSEADVIVATGGIGMVRSAYSSGKPAYGVGPGNVQCLLATDCDVEEAVEKIIKSRTFNLGLPCASEQSIFVHESQKEAALDAFKSRQCVYIDDDSLIRKVADFLYKENDLNRDGVGISAAEVARNVGHEVPEDTQILLLAGNMEEDNLLRREKLCPVSLFYTYSDFDKAVEMACANINLIGQGHSVAIHTQQEELIEKLALAAPVTRVIVNEPSNLAAGGSFFNSFGATTTLGTGFWGNTLLRGNLNYTHLLNITRIGYPPEGARVPSDEEIWGD